MLVSSIVFALGIAVSSHAAPSLRDSHKTIASIGSVAAADAQSKGVELVVQRRDILFDDQGELGEPKMMGLRIHTVKTAFDIDGGQLSCNGDHVPLGTSHWNMDIMTQYLSLDGEDVSQLKGQFDQGLAKMVLDVDISEIIVDEIAIRRATIHQSWLEVNGEKSQERDLVYHVLDIFPDGNMECEQPQVLNAATLEPADKDSNLFVEMKKAGGQTVFQPKQIAEEQEAEENVFTEPVPETPLVVTTAPEESEAVGVATLCESTFQKSRFGQWYAKQTLSVQGFLTGFAGTFVIAAFFFLVQSMLSWVAQLRRKSKGYQAIAKKSVQQF